MLIIFLVYLITSRNNNNQIVYYTLRTCPARSTVTVSFRHWLSLSFIVSDTVTVKPLEFFSYRLTTTEEFD